MASNAAAKTASTSWILFTVACIRRIIGSGQVARSTPRIPPALAMKASSRTESADSAERCTSKLSLSGFSPSTSSISFSNMWRNSASPIFVCFETNSMSRTISSPRRRRSISPRRSESTPSANSTVTVTLS